MERIQIETAQNVLLEYDLANVGDRMLAHLLDYLFFIAYFILIWVLYNKFDLSDVVVFFLILPLSLYDFVLEIVMNGQNLGKQIMKIKVVKIDGSQPTIGSYFLRWVFRLLDSISFGLVAVITISINGKGQRLGDIAAGTTVVRLRHDAVLADTILVEIPDDYQVIFPQVQLLTDQHAKIIKDVLKSLSGKHSAYSIKMAQKAKEAIEKRLQISSELSAKQFLETVIKDYNYVHTGI